MRERAIGDDQPTAVDRQMARRTGEARRESQRLGDTRLAELGAEIVRTESRGCARLAARVACACGRAIGGARRARRVRRAIVRERPFERRRLEVARHTPGERVHARQRHAQRLGRLAERRARAQRGVRADHGHAIVSVGVVHVRDDLVATTPAQVHVEVGAIAALRMEEPLEAQAVTHRVHARHAERIRHDRTGARATAHGGDAAFAREPDDARHEQEVIREPHALDERELVIESRARLAACGRARTARAGGGIALRESYGRERAQAFRAGHARGQRRLREDRCAHLERQVHARDERGVVLEQRFGLFGATGAAAQGAHATRPFVRRGEPSLGRTERVPWHAFEQFACAGGDGRAMRLVVARFEQPHIAGGDRGQSQAPRFGQTRAQVGAFGGDAAHAEPQAARARTRTVGPHEPTRVLVGRTHRRWHAGREQCGGERHRLDDHVQTRVVRRDRRHEVERVVEVPRGQERAQVRPAATIERHEQRARPTRGARRTNAAQPTRARQRTRVVVGRGELGADHGFEPTAARGLEEADRQIQVVAIGQTERGVPEFDGATAQRLGRGDTGEQ
jgi:hypothetical protein